MHQGKDTIKQLDDRVFFEGSNVEELIQHTFSCTKTQVENPRMLESGFKLD